MIASLLTMALPALAQPVTDSNTVTITAKGPAISLPARAYSMSRDEFSQFTGSYWGPVDI